MINSPWAGGDTAASGGFAPSHPFTPPLLPSFTPTPNGDQEYSGLWWITHGLETMLKKESGKRELLSLPIPKSKSNNDRGVKSRERVHVAGRAGAPGAGWISRDNSVVRGTAAVPGTSSIPRSRAGKSLWQRPRRVGRWRLSPGVSPCSRCWG